MPQITFDITDAQLLQLDNLNAARNKRLKEGEALHSRQTLASAAFVPALAAAVAEEEKAAAKEKEKAGKGKVEKD